MQRLANMLLTCTYICMYASGLKAGRLIWVIQIYRVTFCPGQVGLTRFINIWVGPRFCTGSHVLIMASGPDQSYKLSMLDGDDGNVSPDSPQDVWRG